MEGGVGESRQALAGNEGFKTCRFKRKEVPLSLLTMTQTQETSPAKRHRQTIANFNLIKKKLQALRQLVLKWVNYKKKNDKFEF